MPGEARGSAKQGAAIRRRRYLSRTTTTAWLCATLVLLTPADAPATTSPRAPRARRGGFDLRAASTWAMGVNRVLCQIWNSGEVCSTLPSVGAGAMWPAGTPNYYIYNSGIQVAGMIPQDAGIWAGDTVGAYFMDATGLTLEGEAVTPIYSSLNPDDMAAWPEGAIVRDPAIYDPTLLRRPTIAEEDTWVRYYDGPGFLSSRRHPMGILVEQRGLGWNYPAGNEDVLYWVFTLYNVTASDPAVYAGLDQGVADAAQRWVAATEKKLAVDLPSPGYRIDSIYAAFAIDPDVGMASQNASTPILPFDMGVAYKTSFYDVDFKYPPAISQPPFGPYVGLVGVKYLRSPADPVTGQEYGLTFFSNTVNCWSCAFHDPHGSAQLWRYLSGNLRPDLGDTECTYANPKERRVCGLVQTPTDTRFFQSSGPFSLEPGQSISIVVAYLFAAPVADAVLPYFEGYMAPGFPASGTELASDPSLVRPIERAAGWINATDVNGDGIIQQQEVKTVPYSLLDKARVAQSLFDTKFLMPFAPEVPEFYLVPGDNQVTVVWQPSATETDGDPYYLVASDASGALYDPNYRNNDVEGYRIYRGRSRTNLELIAQFDYAGTTFADFTGNWVYRDASGTPLRCAPESGIVDDCPEFANWPEPSPTPIQHDLVGDISQVRGAEQRAVLADGSILILHAFNPIEDAGFPALANTGVPFAYVDNSVINSLTYYYVVTAFDVNSIVSGPATLESALTTQSVTPRTPAPNITSDAAVASVGLFGRGRQLDPTATFTFDGVTGRFAGSPPPSGLLYTLAYDLFVPTALKLGGTSELRVDSVVPEYYDGRYYFSALMDGQRLGVTSAGEGLPTSSHDDVFRSGPLFSSLPVDPALATQIGQAGLPFAGQSSFYFEVGPITFYSGDAEWHYSVDGSFWDSDNLTGLGGSRWFAGADETMDDPTGDENTVLRGGLPQVTTIYSPQPYVNVADDYFRRNRQATWHAARQADVKFYWGATPGTLDSVIDVTHNVPVPFLASTNYGTGWGFRDDIAGRSTTQDAADGIVTEYDFGHGPCYIGRTSWTSPNCTQFPLLQQAELEPVDIDADGVADGPGFGLYFNHEFYIFQTDALPSNTVWTHRSYFGIVGGAPGAYTFEPKTPNSAVPGLKVRWEVTGVSGVRDVAKGDLCDVHTLPDPYYVTSALEITPAQKVLKFINLPERAIIRIYSLSGILVDIIEHNDPGLGGEATWDVRNRNNQLVASGVYFYHVESASGEQKIGRLTVINSGNIVVLENR